MDGSEDRTCRCRKQIGWRPPQTAAVAVRSTADCCPANPCSPNWTGRCPVVTYCHRRRSPLRVCRATSRRRAAWAVLRSWPVFPLMWRPRSAPGTNCTRTRPRHSPGRESLIPAPPLWQGRGNFQDGGPSPPGRDHRNTWRWPRPVTPDSRPSPSPDANTAPFASGLPTTRDAGHLGGPPPQPLAGWRAPDRLVRGSYGDLIARRHHRQFVPLRKRPHLHLWHNRPARPPP